MGRVGGDGISDPARSLALLWGTRRRSGFGPKSEVDLEKIVLAAIRMADEEGLPSLSMRRIGAALGVSAMSLYTYVPGKAELIDVMVDVVCGEVVHSERAAVGWRPRLERVAREHWALCRRHPWLLQVSGGRPRLGPRAIAKYEHELRAVEGVGLSDIEMDLVVALVVDHAESAARRAVEAARLRTHSGQTDEQWWRAHGSLIDPLAGGGGFPLASRVGSAVGTAYGTPYPAEFSYEFGLGRLLDGIGMLVEACAARSETNG